ncbi:hypothetical protein LSAT2_012591 [Lamellibrachia satsuma]|nr:hypothetical protein LSAT2_012591 [Lamellibrachia satsuma]
MPSSGIAVTGPGNIPCSCIIHIDARMDLTSVVNNVLDEAERRQIESVAFPALGTGVLKQTPFEAANNMLQAIKHFVKSHTVNYLRLVRIVIFEQNMMESFRRCFLEKTNTSGTTQPVFSSSHRNGPDAGVHTGPKKQPVVQVQWRYDDGKGIGFQDYREEINIKLETIYASKKKAKPFQWTDDTHVKHKVYFDRMKDVCNSTERVVRRTVMFDDIMLPYSWSPMESYDQHKVEEVKASSEEYSKVQKNFHEGMLTNLPLSKKFREFRIQACTISMHYAESR